MTGHPVIGILGGMGPEATADLMRRVIAATPAEDDIDHIHMIVDNNPKVPSRIKALIDGTGESPGPTLANMARGLADAGAHALAMPCNTAHAYLGDIETAVSIPVLNMIGLTATRLATLNPATRRVGILASTAVNTVGLYEQTFAGLGISVRVPDRQDDLMGVIKDIKRGDLSPSTQSAFCAVAHDLANSDVDSLLVACTELSIMADCLPADIPAVDAMDVLSNAIIRFATSPTTTISAA